MRVCMCVGMRWRSVARIEKTKTECAPYPLLCGCRTFVFFCGLYRVFVFMPGVCLYVCKCVVEIIYILFIVHERNKVRSMAIYAISDHGFIMSFFFKKKNLSSPIVCSLFPSLRGFPLAGL